MTTKDVRTWGEGDFVGLSPLDIIKLSYPFQPWEHQFIQGMVYLKETAIKFRLDKVDPNWQFIPQEVYQTLNGFGVRSIMQVKSVTRGNLGGGGYLTEKSSGEVLKSAVIMDNIGNAYKASTTDSFKRCARLFGVGAYLLRAPKEGAEFNTWLANELVKAKAEYAALNVVMESVPEGEAPDD